MTRPSYWLKIDRAEEHLVSLNALLSPYDLALPFRINHAVEGKNRDHVYRIWTDKEVDPRIAIYLGDFLFELRSALDHLRASLVPANRKRSGYFPIVVDDIWQRHPTTGEYLERTEQQRKSWFASVKDMDPRAVDKIDYFQPFRQGAQGDPSHQALAILARLNNADKHRELVPTIRWLEPVRTVVHYPDGRSEEFGYAIPEATAGQPGAEVFRSHAEVEVKTFGVLKIAVGVRPEPQGFAGYAIRDTCEGILSHVRDNIIPTLEEHVT